MSGPLATVVVCTRNRSALLARCLEALAKQTLPRDCFEIVVVDNASNDGTPEILRSWQQRLANLRSIREPMLGVSHARNAGLAQTETELIAYVDDDCFARLDWLENLLAPFDLAERPAVVGGEVEPIWETDRPAWLTDQYLHPYSVCFRWSDSGRFLRKGEWLVEENCAYDCRALREAGAFAVGLGRRGTMLLGAENFVNKVIESNGHRLYFEPAAVVDHLVHAERLNPKWLARRLFWGGITAALVERFAQSRLNEPTPMTSIYLPRSYADWAVMVDLEPDSRLDRALSHYHQLGYLLARRGLVDV